MDARIPSSPGIHDGFDFTILNVAFTGRSVILAPAFRKEHFLLSDVMVLDLIQLS